MNTLYKNTVKAFLALGLIIGMNSISHASEFPADNYISDEISEETFSLEEWMLNLDEWESFKLQKDIETGFEEELVIESWMLEANESDWSLIHKVEIEEEQQLENWMSDISKW